MTNVAKRSDAVQPKVVPFFDDDSNTFSYVVSDPTSSACAIIDSVLEFDMANGNVDRVGADSIIRYVEKEGLKVEWIIETHVHADHLTAAPYLKNRLGGKIAIGDKVVPCAGGVRTNIQRRERVQSRWLSIRSSICRW